MYIEWITTNEVNEIYLPEDLKREIITSSKTITFHFGSWNKELYLHFIKEIPNDTIGLSENLRKDVFIPEELIYDINMTEKSLSLGPVVLYLVSNRLIKRLDKLKERIENFVPLNGLIIISSSLGINTEKETIEGYYFQPKTETINSKLMKETFSYPGAIFKRALLSPSIDTHLYEKMGGRIFNSKFFNKWEMWQWLTSNDFLKNNLPHTKELKSLEEVNDMLDVYHSIYLKPKKGSNGKGIIQIEKNDFLFHITNDKCISTRGESLENHPLIKSVFERENQYIIQQGIPVKHHSRHVDFRIYMQKDETMRWKCSGFIGRFAIPGSITTNLQNIDDILPGQEALRLIFELEKEEVRLVEQKIITICTEACQLLDQHGCYGDIAIDCIVDNDLHVWILEMNKRYGYRSFYFLEDRKLFSKIIRNPFLYASALAGFSGARERQKL
ncbi:hypothetical protein CR203_03560 [Salipaludibacillus neizhouensis]|uniref:ATP-grasp domain-containing protein n=1 Tax=Salipaludibacillus neizhouensis TaxID=885475 RepID=A0A3A9KMK1_9BACI|nr:YheC/YheD family protein [Salipaludibacillus neizhouensis]RKL69125.1 hypothetical protein CR203_03560 [Salipaludibacillus neizhouensis]